MSILNGENRNSHFVLVTNFPKLLDSVTFAKRRQKSRVIKPEEPWHKEETLYCNNCLNRFSSVHGSQSLLDHQLACLHDRPTKFEQPQEDKRNLKFNNFQYMKMHPFVIYADLKAVNTLVQDDLPHGSTIIESIHHICA